MSNYGCADGIAIAFYEGGGLKVEFEPPSTTAVLMHRGLFEQLVETENTMLKIRKFYDGLCNMREAGTEFTDIEIIAMLGDIING